MQDELSSFILTFVDQIEMCTKARLDEEWSGTIGGLKVERDLTEESAAGRSRLQHPNSGSLFATYRSSKPG
jgi:hypothetical protein